MKWSVYADLARPLTADERHAVFAALEELVPESGCVGPDRRGVEEVFFVVAAPTREAAREAATAALGRVLAAAGVRVDHAITIQAESGGAG
jgi:hypothetical protein